METYREKLKSFLLDNGVKYKSAYVYLAGSQNKKPNGELRFKAYRELKHPFDAWGDKMRPYLDAQKAKEAAKSNSNLKGAKNV